jgi:hypothetical protein
LSVSGKLTGTLSGFIVRVKSAPFGLLYVWREMLILRQHQPMRGVEVIPSAHQIHWWLGITASHMLFIIWRNFDVGCFFMAVQQKQELEKI